MHLRRLLTVQTFIFLLLYPFAYAETSDRFSLSERRWAERWVNRNLATLMSDGTIKRIEAGDSGFKVFVGEPWYSLGIDKRTAHLQNLSRAREIAGHSPFFSVFDAETEEVVARVRRLGIDILVPGYGFVQYMPETPDGSPDIPEQVQ